MIGTIENFVHLRQSDLTISVELPSLGVQPVMECASFLLRADPFLTSSLSLLVFFPVGILLCPQNCFSLYVQIVYLVVCVLNGCAAAGPSCVFENVNTLNGC